MKYLVFDTETTGKADFKLPPEDPVQPRLVQLGAILYEDTHVMAELNLIVRPNGFTIPDEAAKVHGITTEKALAFGVDEKLALLCFSALLEKAETLVAHNIQFDGIVIGRAYHIHNLIIPPPAKKVCTMHSMTDVCKISGPYGPKWPSLMEAFVHVTGSPFDGAHDAMADVRACAKVFQWLNKMTAPLDVKQEPHPGLQDLDPMPFGKHKGEAMQDVPAAYLHWLWTNGKKADLTCPVAAYIRKSLSALKQENPHLIWT